jgi:hypothetical protein
MVLNFNRITGTLYHPSLSDATKIVDDPRKTDIPGQGAYRLFQRNVIYCPEKRILYFISDRSVPAERSKHEVQGGCPEKQCFFGKKSLVLEMIARNQTDSPRLGEPLLH